MRYKFLYLLSIILFTSCNHTFNQAQEEGIPSHSYDEINELIIPWEEAFLQTSNDYYVYFFSKTCHYCEEIKNEIIEIALHTIFPIYFCNENNIQTDRDLIVESTIGINDILDFKIKGFPSVIEVKKNAVFKHKAGKTDTLVFLRNIA